MIRFLFYHRQLFYDNYARGVTKSGVNMIQYLKLSTHPRSLGRPSAALLAIGDTRRAANPLVRREVELRGPDPTPGRKRISNSRSPGSGSVTGPPAAHPPRLQFDSTFPITSLIQSPKSASGHRHLACACGEVMLAYQMNGEQSPLLNGFTLRLIVPGWYSTYWIKMLNDVEVLNPPEEL
jgi:hypothetical protein